MAAPTHASELNELGQTLATDLVRGLDEGEAAERLRAVGPNRLAAATRPPYARLAARQLADPLVALLLAATVVSVLIGEHAEALVIAAIVTLNAALGFVQEAGADRAVLALRTTMRPTAQVIRDGRERELAAAEVVPGDVLVLREGDRVAADARVAATEGLQLDESVLTGESLPVVKLTAPVAVDAALGDRTSVVFAGTGVTRGRGRALVTATGAATEIGRIAALTTGARPPRTPLQARLGSLARVLVVLGVAVTVALTAAMLLRGASLEEAFLIGVAVAVAAVPEGLAATVTITLAQGARAMARRGAIVRRLAAVETLGAATVIAADKTGTLTVNRLRVAAVAPESGRSEGEVLDAAVLASTADLLETGTAPAVVGDPVDGAFLLEAAQRRRPDARAGREQARVVPFDADRKRLTVVYSDGGRLHAYVKGAPEVVLGRAQISPRRRQELLDATEAWASDGLRVLAVAEQAVVAAAAGDDDLDADLQIVGLVGLVDPLRPGAAASIARAREAGLELAILTGDHPVTAAAIAASLGLGDEQPLTGPELELLSADELARTVRGRSVFARVTPSDKLRLVEALQREGHVVAVTGDGINDTPALRRGDVGVAMGGSGTEAAREAADVVLTDDDFATIVAAIGEGRRIADNIRSFVAFLLSANLGEVVLFAVAVTAGLGAPLTVVQVLTVNLITDGLPALALSGDPAAADVLSRPPRGRKSLLPRRLRVTLALLGLAVGLAALAAFMAGRALDEDAAQTMAFATIALAELVLVFSIRSGERPAWRAPGNPFLVASVSLSAAFVAAAVYLEPLGAAFGTVPLEPRAAAVVLALAAAPALAAEAGKAVLRAGASSATASARTRKHVPRPR